MSGSSAEKDAGLWPCITHGLAGCEKCWPRVAPLEQPVTADKDAGPGPEFTAFLDRVLESHEARAAYDRAELRQLTYGMDRRQARRVRRRYYAAIEADA